MRRATAIFASCLLVIGGIPASFADVVSSDEIMLAEQSQYNKQQVLSYVDSDAAQAELVALGVDIADARNRIANLTDAEISALNARLQDMPAGGVLGTVATVLVVIAVLDMLGITDVFSFIDPIV